MTQRRCSVHFAPGNGGTEKVGSRAGQNGAFCCFPGLVVDMAVSRTANAMLASLLLSFYFIKMHDAEMSKTQTGNGKCVPCFAS